MSDINYSTDAPLTRKEHRAALREQCLELYLELREPKEIAEALTLSLPRTRKLMAEVSRELIHRRAALSLQQQTELAVLDWQAKKRYYLRKLYESENPRTRTRRLTKTKTIRTKGTDGQPDTFTTVDDGTEEVTETVQHFADPRWGTLINDCDKEIAKLLRLYPKETGPTTTTQTLVIIAEERIPAPPPPAPVNLLPSRFVFDEEPPPLPEQTEQPPPLPPEPLKLTEIPI